MSPRPGFSVPSCRCADCGPTAAGTTCDAALILSAVLDGFALLGAVRDDSGGVVDFHLLQLKAPSTADPGQRDAYAAAIDRGRTLLSAMPSLADNGLFADIVSVLL